MAVGAAALAVRLTVPAQAAPGDSPELVDGETGFADPRRFRCFAISRATPMDKRRVVEPRCQAALTHVRVAQAALRRRPYALNGHIGGVEEVNRRKRHGLRHVAQCASL